MKKLLQIGIVIGAAFAMIGCGGKGDSRSQFQGVWSGPFQVYNPGGSVESSGNMLIEVDSFGGAAIRLDRTDRNQQTQYINGGYIDTDRNLRFVCRWNDTNDRETRGEVRINGNFLQGASSNRQLGTRFAGGGTGGMEFTLTRN